MMIIFARTLVIAVTKMGFQSKVIYNERVLILGISWWDVAK